MFPPETMPDPKNVESMINDTFDDTNGLCCPKGAVLKVRSIYSKDSTRRV